MKDFLQGRRRFFLEFCEDVEGYYTQLYKLNTTDNIKLGYIFNISRNKSLVKPLWIHTY